MRVALWMTMILLTLVFVLTGCAKPKVSELLKDGINCKAQIEMPDGYRGESVEVKVRIFDCEEPGGAQ